MQGGPIALLCSTGRSVGP